MYPSVTLYPYDPIPDVAHLFHAIVPWFELLDYRERKENTVAGAVAPP